MIFDTHAHYDDGAFDTDRDEVIKTLPQKGVGYVINCGCDILSSQKALALAEKYPHVYAATGVHPENLNGAEDGYLEKIKSLAEHKKCVAIGEIGLDYHYGKENKEKQKEIFIEQIRLANCLSLPVIIHERDAYKDCLEILKSERPKKGVMHCFSGNSVTLREVLELGLYIGVGGTLTFKNNVKTVEMIRYVPKDRLLFETDAPYLSPVPLRGKRNSSENIKYVSDKAAEILGVPAEELLDLTLKNAKRLFNIL